jgi:hypothetical protein
MSDITGRRRSSRFSAALRPHGHAQQPAMPVIGFLSARSARDSALLLPAFHQGLKEAGYVEGQHVAIEYRWADDQYEPEGRKGARSHLPTIAAWACRRGHRMRHALR